MMGVKIPMDFMRMPVGIMRNSIQKRVGGAQASKGNREPRRSKRIKRMRVREGC